MSVYVVAYGQSSTAEDAHRTVASYSSMVPGSRHRPGRVVLADPARTPLAGLVPKQRLSQYH
eukprot:3934744-Rhodomonas_salina.1